MTHLSHIEIKDICREDIPSIMDYWLNPANRDYHARRGVIMDSSVANNLVNQPAILERQIRSPLNERKSTTNIICKKGEKIGHILLNEIHDSQRIRMHFHLWPKKLLKDNLGAVIKDLGQIIPMSLEFYFDAFPIDHIFGEISLENVVGFKLLERMGYTPIKKTRAVYLGQEADYWLYKFTASP